MSDAGKTIDTRSVNKFTFLFPNPPGHERREHDKVQHDGKLRLKARPISLPRLKPPISKSRSRHLAKSKLSHIDDLEDLELGKKCFCCCDEAREIEQESALLNVSSVSCYDICKL